MLDYNDIKILAKKILDEMEKQTNADLAPKWDDATIVIQPKNGQTKSYEIPVEKFFNKIILIRDNLRVLEQQINSNDKLTHGEKVKFQNYITKCYGSMTSFNILFYNDDDKF